MHYRFQGSGRTVLLLHMACSSSDEFTRMIPFLSKNYRVIAPDHLGFGESDMPPREYQTADYARSILSFMDSLNIEKASILGHHAAAQIAVEIAVTCPDRVESLILSGIPCSRDLAERLAKRIHATGGSDADGSHLMRGASQSIWRIGGMQRGSDYFKVGPRGEEMHWSAAKYHALPKRSYRFVQRCCTCGSEDWMLPGWNRRDTPERVRHY